MGLTLHYNIEFNGTAKQLQAKLEKIRQACCDLPFEDVGEVKTVKITKKIIDIWNMLQKKYTYPNNTDENIAKRDLIMKNLGVTTDEMIESGELKIEGRKCWKVVKPTTMVSLSLWPGKGCESADLNFKRRKGKFVCDSFCKTQYAEHFVQCHLLVIQLLDLLKEADFVMADIYDEGEYWETKEIKILAKNINESTAMISSILGGLQQAAKKAGMVVEAPIEKCQNYLKVDEK
jgi:hypothetical protein